MKERLKYLGTAVLLLTLVFMPTLVKADAPITLSANSGSGYVHLSWNISIDEQVYKLSGFKIYRSIQAGFTPDDSSLMVEVYNPQLTSFDDYNVEVNKTYYYIIRPLDINTGEILSSNEASASPDARQPHGYYDSKTAKCSVCHSGHSGKGEALVNTELSSAEDLCKICHEPGGESKLTINGIKKYSCTKNCNECHNPHGNNDQQKFVPMLLQVTIGGKVYFQASNPENGVGNEFCFVSACHTNFEDFSYNPPIQGGGHDSINLVNKQAREESKTGITCFGCHANHGSDLRKAIREQVYWNGKEYDFNADAQLFSADGNVLVDNYNNFCLSCHENKRGLWEGKNAYQNSSNKHKDLACNACHDPHGKDGRADYLKDKYAFSVITNNTIEENFKLCFNSGCHDVNAFINITNIETKFSGVFDGETVNLHVYHLEYKGDAEKRALCRDCHDPHGVDITQNPGQKYNISFIPNSEDSAYIAAYGYKEPRYTSPSESGDNRASCNLYCHGVKHSEESGGDGIYSVYGAVY